MIDLSEKTYSNTYKKPEKAGNVVVIDNGQYELRAGFLHDPCLMFCNHIFKYKSHVSLEPFPQASMKAMFDEDIIVNFDTLEATLDTILEHLQPNTPFDLIFTTAPSSPTEPDLVEFLYNLYPINKLQLAPDYIYAYHNYFKNEDALVIALKHSSVIVSYISDGKEKEIFKNTFGVKKLQEYVNLVMSDRYKNYKKDYSRLVEHIRVSQDYNSEALEIYNELCSGRSKNNLVITDIATTAPQELARKTRKSNSTVIQIPDLDLELIQTPDKDLEHASLKEKRRQRMVFFGVQNRLKMKASAQLKEMSEQIAVMEDELEKRSNPGRYIERKKDRFQDLLRKLELREKLRHDARNRKTREFQIKIKEGVLDQAEQQIREQIAEAEDESIEAQLHSQLDRVLSDILALEPDFKPFIANTVDILRGDAMGVQCVNIELIKWAEIFFEPSIIGSEQMGLSEVFENISALYEVKNVLICGGVSHMPGLAERCLHELTRLSKTGPVNVVVSADPRMDPFKGACFSDIYPVYTREGFQK